MTKPSEGSKELLEILFDWHKWRDYYYSDLKKQVITDDEWKVTRDKIDDEAVARIQAHIKAEIRKTLLKIKEQLPEEATMPPESLKEKDNASRVKYAKCLTASVNYNQALTEVKSAIDNEIKELEER